MKINKTIAKRMSKLHGTIRRKEKGGNFYYRLTITSGIRKEFSLKTRDEAEAVQKAEEIDAIYMASTLDVALAQISAIKGFSKLQQNLNFEDAYKKYLLHPEKANPHTIAEHNLYKAHYDEFIKFITSSLVEKKIYGISDITHEEAYAFSQYLRTKKISVDTHNRKIKHLRKIFSCLSDYYNGNNPFQSKVLMRSSREEQNFPVRRLAFTKEQEQQLREVLADAKHKVMNKPEIRVIYYLGMFTGQRLKDCVLLQWQNVDMKHKRIFVKQFKTGKEVTIPMAEELYQVLTEAQKWREDQYVCPKSAARYNKVDEQGKNVGNNLLNIDTLRVIKWIGLEPSVAVPGRTKKVTVYGFHSLRHSFVSFCAEAGVPRSVLMAIIGTDSELIDRHYTHISESAKQEAIAIVSGNQ